MGPHPPGEQPKLQIPGVQNIIAVGSGRGGGGKSTIAVNLASSLQKLGHTVGLMDADVYGPNIPLMLGATETPRANGQRIQRIDADGLEVMSVALLSPGRQRLAARGPM